MRKLRIYLDTSAIGYLDEISSPKEMDEMHTLWTLTKNGEYSVVISPVVMDELMANQNSIKRDILFSYLKQVKYTIAEITDDVHKIAKSVVLNGVLPDRNYNDCLHIACAITSGCDCIVSYNFKHLVNIHTIKGVRAISNLHGNGNIDIVSAINLIQRGAE